VNWNQLVKEGRAERFGLTREALDDMRSLVGRNLRDAALAQLSLDNRLGLAYEAALILAKIAIGCEGYRIKGFAHHRTTLEALPLAMGVDEQDASDLFESFRLIRNQLSYDAAGIVSESDAATALAEALALAERVERWIASRHPMFKP